MGRQRREIGSDVLIARRLVGRLHLEVEVEQEGVFVAEHWSERTVDLEIVLHRGQRHRRALPEGHGHGEPVGGEPVVQPEVIGEIRPALRRGGDPRPHTGGIQRRGGILVKAGENAVVARAEAQDGPLHQVASAGLEAVGEVESGESGSHLGLPRPVAPGIVPAVIAAARVGEPESEFLSAHRRPPQVEDRTEAEARAGAQHEAASVVDHGVGCYLYLVGRELIGAAVRRVEHRIVEAVVELVERVRNLRVRPEFLEIGELGLILVGHLHALAYVLRERRKAACEQRREYCDTSHLQFCIRVSSLSSLIFTPEAMSSLLSAGS